MKYFMVLFVLLSSLLLIGQVANDDCVTPTVLCGNQPTLANNIGATVSVCPGCSDGASAAGNFCFSIENSTWFTFTTNPFGGDVTINFSNLNCKNDPTYGATLQAVVLQASIPCDESSYSAVSNCVANSASDFSLTAPGLAPNTTYYILVDGNMSGLGVTNPSECFFNIETTGQGVEYIVDAGADVSIEYRESAQLAGTAQNGFVWSPPNFLSSPSSLTPTSSPESTMTYYLSIATADGCVYQDEVTVFVFEPISIPNTLTPNNDGYNDTWEIGRIDNFPGAEVVVYDRWGQQVFKTIGYTNSKRWDGTNSGKRLPSGTYFYSIDLKTGAENSVLVGPITIIH